MSHSIRTKPLDEDLPNSASSRPDVLVVDEGCETVQLLETVSTEAGFCVRHIGSIAEFYAHFAADQLSCIVAEIDLPDGDGIALLEHVRRECAITPLIFFTGCDDVGLAVKALKGGAADYIVKPCAVELLLARIREVLQCAKEEWATLAARREVVTRLGSLTDREQQVLSLLSQGQHSKEIAVSLGISPRTVDSHRANIMKKVQARSLPELFRLLCELRCAELLLDPRETTERSD